MVNTGPVTELFRSADLLVRCRPGADTRRWIVTFDSFSEGDSFNEGHDDSRSSLTRMVFGEEFLIKRGFSMIAVLGRDNRWYQYPEMRQALECIAAVTRQAEKVLTYGSSMGGYAALRFADAIHANIVLTFSPQYTADPRAFPFERRWRGVGRTIDWLPEWRGRLTCRATPLVFYDSRFWPDALQAALIARDTPTQRIALPHAGHPVTQFLHDIGLITGLVPALLEDRFDVEDFQHAVRAARDSSRKYQFERRRFFRKLWPF